MIFTVALLTTGASAQECAPEPSTVEKALSVPGSGGELQLQGHNFLQALGMFNETHPMRISVEAHFSKLPEQSLPKLSATVSGASAAERHKGEPFESGASKPRAGSRSLLVLPGADQRRHYQSGQGHGQRYSEPAERDGKQE